MHAACLFFWPPPKGLGSPIPNPFMPGLGGGALSPTPGLPVASPTSSAFQPACRSLAAPLRSAPPLSTTFPVSSAGSQLLHSLHLCIQQEVKREVSEGQT